MQSHTSDSQPRPLVLIVEDDAAMRSFLDEILSDHYRTALAVNGEDGLEKATRLRPDLILTDIMMPKMGGDRMFAAVRSDRRTDRIPVVILSGKGDDAVRMKLLREGANDYVNKPFVIEELLSRVRNLVHAKLALENLDRERAENARSAAENARLCEEARKAIAFREEVLGVVSHDLRTPLSAVRLQCQMISRTLRGSNELGRIEKYLAGAERSIGQMNRLIGDLLDFAQVQSGTLSLKKADHPVDVLLEDARRLNQPVAAEKRIALRIVSENDLADLSCDSGRVLQVLTNLLGNAIKFSPASGTITVGAREEDGEVRFSVADEGPGIPEENLTSVFEKFWRAEKTASLGAGLGLAISRGIVVGHGGKIWVENTPGAGATFFFTIPRGDAAARVMPSAMPLTLRNETNLADSRQEA